MNTLPLAIEIEGRLEKFYNDYGFNSPGPLAVSLLVTKWAIEDGMPIDPSKHITKSGTQVSGLNGKAANKILKEYGIERSLGTETGRTSRGSVNNMTAFATLLNEFYNEGFKEFTEVQRWCVERVSDFFGNQPFKLKVDSAKSILMIVRDLLEQAQRRQKEYLGATFAGTMLQHLVGAKLELVFGAGKVTHHGVSTADAPTGREGDFLVGDVAIHVTTAPSDNLLQKCRANLEAGVRPLIITTQEGAGGGQAHARNFGIEERIDIIEIEQFLTANIYERSLFLNQERTPEIQKLINKYNQLIEEFGTDPSLRITID